MLGRRFNEGLHQALEAKEGVKVERENKTLATITFQNYFRMFKKLAGMTGTAKTEESEFMGIYDIDVVEIPTNRPLIRRDDNDAVYATEEGKFRAVVSEIEAVHKTGQPLLVGTISVERSEYLSELLSRRGIRHEVLSAKYHAKEAEIVAQAGKLGSMKRWSRWAASASSARSGTRAAASTTSCAAARAGRAIPAVRASMCRLRTSSCAALAPTACPA